MKKKIIGVLTIVLCITIFGNSTFSVFALASESENFKTELIYQTEGTLNQIELQDKYLTDELNSKVEQLHQYLYIDNKGVATLNPPQEVKDLFTQEEYDGILYNIKLTNEMVEQGLAIRDTNGGLELMDDGLCSASNSNDIKVKWHWFYVDLKMTKKKAAEVAFIMKEVSRGVATLGALISCFASSVSAKIIGFIISAIVGTYLSAMSDTLTKYNNKGKNGAIMRIYYIPVMTFKSW